MNNNNTSIESANESFSNSKSKDWKDLSPFWKVVKVIVGLIILLNFFYIFAMQASM